MDHEHGTLTLDVDGAIDRAIQCYQVGQAAAAEAVCDGVLAQRPDEPDALHLLAMMACDRGNAAGALAYLAVAITQKPASAAFHNTRARALTLLGRTAEAESAYRYAWLLKPGLAAIANNLACLLRDCGRLEEATCWFQTARGIMPGSAEIARNLAGALAARQLFEPASQEYQRCIQIDPSSADAYAGWGAVLLACGRAPAAERVLRSALSLRPDDAACLNNLGLALRGQGRNADATACFNDAIGFNSGFADAHYNLGCLQLLANRASDARGSHDRALAAAPLHGSAQWGRCMAELPVLYDTPEQIVEQRARYTEQLAVLERRAADPQLARAMAAASGASQPFFLPYQGQPDRELQARYGRLMARLLYRGEPDLATPPAPGEAIRLGIVSGYFCEHTIWRLMLKGWLGQIDRDRFHMTAYHTGAAQDGQTAVARQLCPRFVTGSAEAIRSAIVADQPHVLLYPEIGMDRVAARLGAERLAPLQCVAWGQPQTTGLPTMDLFISSALMEPEGAQSHYTERLATLPGIGVYYGPDERAAETCTRAGLGLRERAAVFWCGQALYKYLPQDDDVFPRIAAQLEDCQFLFIGFAEDSAVTEQFHTRLRRAFASHKLDCDRHVRILDPMPQGRFLATVRLADVVLDSLGWSGGKSTLDMLAEAPVIVTHPGPMMRGRHTAAILTAAGVTDTIAPTKAAYCQLAVQLARDPAACDRLRRRMVAGRSAILADAAPIRALETLLAGRA